VTGSLVTPDRTAKALAGLKIRGNLMIVTAA
jgi:hypothetical protein